MKYLDRFLKWLCSDHREVFFSALLFLTSVVVLDSYGSDLDSGQGFLWVALGYSLFWLLSSLDDLFSKSK